MILKKENIQEQILPNFQGGEKAYIARMFIDNNNKIMFGKLESGASIGMHCHNNSAEVIYLVKGKAKVLYDEAIEYLNEGEIHYCEEGHKHSLINDSNSTIEFIAVVPKYNNK